MFNLLPLNSSLRTIVISYDSLLEIQCDRNFDLLHTFQLIAAQFNSDQFCDWLKCFYRVGIFVALAF